MFFCYLERVPGIPLGRCASGSSAQSYPTYERQGGPLGPIPRGKGCLYLWKDRRVIVQRASNLIREKLRNLHTIHFIYHLAEKGKFWSSTKVGWVVDLKDLSSNPPTDPLGDLGLVTVSRHKLPHKVVVMIYREGGRTIYTPLELLGAEGGAFNIIIKAHLTAFPLHIAPFCSLQKCKFKCMQFKCVHI